MNLEFTFRLILKILFQSFLVVYLSSCTQKSIPELLDKARALDSIGKHTEANVLYDEILEIDDKNISAFIGRGVNNQILGKNEEAILDMTSVIKIDRRNPLAYFNRALFKANKGDYSGSISDFNRCIRIKGGETLWLDRVENSFVETGWQYEVSMEQIRFERGVVYYYSDSLRKAFFDFNFAIDRKFQVKEAYFYRGLVWLKSENLENACQDLQEAVKYGNEEAVEVLKLNCH